MSADGGLAATARLSQKVALLSSIALGVAVLGAATFYSAANPPAYPPNDVPGVLRVIDAEKQPALLIIAAREQYANVYQSGDPFRVLFTGAITTGFRVMDLRPDVEIFPSNLSGAVAGHRRVWLLGLGSATSGTGDWGLNRQLAAQGLHLLSAVQLNGCFATLWARA
jgi:hypothetical protein